MQIYYGICGVGLGHAGRSLPVIRELSKSHTVHIFTSRIAYKFLKNENLPNLHEIPGLDMITHNNKVLIWPTVKSFVELLHELQPAIDNIVKTIPKSDLCITDYELIVPRLAYLHQCPSISIDNQHKFLVPSEKLPTVLKTYCFLAGQFTKWLIPHTTENLITTFHPCDITYKNYHHVGVVIREELLKLKSNPQNFNLVYIKDCLENKVIRTLKQIPEENFYIYGSTRTGNDLNLTFRSQSNIQFAQDLLDCKRIICAAGNQLIGEAKYFKKPVFAIPLPNQDEQAVNAYFVKLDKIGNYCKIKRLTPEKIRAFLQTAYQIDTIPNGLDEIIKFLEPYLSNHSLKPSLVPRQSSLPIPAC